MNADRFMRLLARGSTRGNPGGWRITHRPKGEGEGLIATVRRIFGRR